MKRGVLISLALASILGIAQAGEYKMGGGFGGMTSIQNHVEEAGQNASSSSDSNVSSGVASSSSSASVVASTSVEAQASNSSVEPQPVSSSSAPTTIKPIEMPKPHKGGMQSSSVSSSMMEPPIQEARSSAMSQASSAHSQAMGHMQGGNGENNSSMAMMGHGEHRGLLALIENGTIPNDLPPQIHNTLKEVKKAVKFYKHPELFEDLNITDVTNLDPQTLQEIQERVQRAKEEHIERVKQKLLGNRPKAELPIAGEFVRIGEGQYDWVFVTKSGHVYKLAGVNSDGKFKYEPLPGVQGIIEQDGKVIFEPQTQNLPVALPQEPASGYPFAKYNDPQEDGFNWIVVTKSGRVYKFEGFDEDSKSFFYTPVDGLKAQPKGDEVEILPGS